MTKDRKQALLKLLKEAPKALNGQTLAEHFHVTRQVIVQDIAILRADGAPILSTNRGYIYKENDASPYVHKLFKVKHELEEIGQELLAIVDNGGRVQNILIIPFMAKLKPYSNSLAAEMSSTFWNKSRIQTLDPFLN